MPKELRKLIEETIEASQLGETEKDELRRELESHILAHIYELEVAGKSEVEIVAEIKSAFGDSNEIGRELFYAHHKFENLPIVGPLLYYRPIRLGARLFVWYVGMFLIFSIWQSVFINWAREYFMINFVLNEGVLGKHSSEPYFGTILNAIDFIQALVYRISELIPFAISMFLGRWLYRKVQSVAHMLETIAFSYIPFFFLLLIEVLYAISVRGTTIYDATVLTVLLLLGNTAALLLIPTGNWLYSRVAQKIRDNA